MLMLCCFVGTEFMFLFWGNLAAQANHEQRYADMQQMTTPKGSLAMRRMRVLLEALLSIWVM